MPSRYAKADVEQPNLVGMIRQMPPERAIAYAKGLKSLLDWNPYLRQSYSGQDIAYIENLARRNADHRELANFYSAILTSQRRAGLPVTQAAIDALRDELGGIWDFQLKRHGEDVAYYAAAHAPAGGVTIGGVFHKGGTWIPSSVVASATSAEKAQIAKGGSSKKKDRAQRGPVDRDSIAERLKEHRGRRLSKKDRQVSERALRSLRDHHGDTTAQRLEELIAATELQYDRNPDVPTSRRLKILFDMLDDEVRRTSAERPDQPGSLSAKLSKYRDVRMSPQDANEALMTWQSLQADYGEHVASHMKDMADQYIVELANYAPGSQDAIALKTKLAALAWMADRYRQEVASPTKE